MNPSPFLNFLRSKFTRLNFFLILLLIIAIGYLSQIQSYKTENILGLNFSSQPQSEKLFSKKPIKVNAFKNATSFDEFKIKFLFSNKDKYFSYGNLFQTSNSKESLRMEVQPPSKLAFINGDEKIYYLDKDIQSDRTYDAVIHFKKNSFIHIYLDNNLLLNIEDKEYLTGKFDFSSFFVGTGYDRKRTFSGNISNFEISARYNYFGFISTFLKMCATFILILFFYKLSHHLNLNNLLKVKHTSKFYFSFIHLYVFASLTVFIGVFFALCFNSAHFGFSKWIAYALLPIVPLIYMAFGDRLNVKNIQLFIIFLFIAGLFLASSLLAKPHLLNFWVVLMVCCTAYFYCINSIHNLLFNSSIGVKSKIINPIFFTLILLIIWLSLFDLTNWASFKTLISNQFVESFFGFLSLLIITVYFFVDKSNKLVKSNLLDFLFFLLSITVFLIFSFRYDSLFIPGSEYHWEYYHGVIQGLKNGGWLLLDTPSQYGFLNLIIPSLIHAKSAWQSFYLFQSFLLFITCSALYIAIVKIRSLSIFDRFFIFIILFLSFFYADPGFIGPYPFPSSSVVRFFPVYLFLIASFSIKQFSFKQAFTLSCIWTFSALWSAEAALYGTSIMVFILVGLFLVKSKANSNLKILMHYLLMPLVFLCIFLLIISIYYHIHTHSLPAFKNYFDYALGYAGGFGYVPFSFLGPGNLLFIIFVIFSCVFLEIRKSNIKNINKYAITFSVLTGVIWAIASYYIGRPVPQNITAMLPLIASVLIISIVALKDKLNYFFIITIPAIPVFIIVMFPLINFSWYQELGKFKTFSRDITLKLLRADDEMESLINKANLKHNHSIVYYGDDARQPYFRNSTFNENNWLPIPLQLLEDPLSLEKRNNYLFQYVCRHPVSSGLLISQNSDSIKPRLNNFINSLDSFYSIKKIDSSNRYELYLFNNFSNKECDSKI